MDMLLLGREKNNFDDEHIAYPGGILVSTYSR